jgi:hypothetical protein
MGVSAGNIVEIGTHKHSRERREKIEAKLTKRAILH